MKKIFYTALVICLALVSCDNDKKGEGTNTYLAKSVGRINSLQVIVDNELWNGAVGEKIREHFAAPTLGLPQEEPIFTISQMIPETHEGFARSSRTFLHVSLGTQDTLKLRKDVYARPQAGAYITGTSEESLITLIDQNHERIINAFKGAETKERQKRTKISALKIDSLKDRFGLSLSVPSAYRVASANDQFYWLRKDLRDGETNILIYRVPMSTIHKDSLVIGEIIRMRDSIGSGYLLVEDDGLFVTEEAYAPFLEETLVDGKFAYETKGTWEVKGEYMAGPFTNYAIMDEKNGEYLVLEGFTYAPEVEKRDLQFELESILKSAQIE